ncbi:MAG TPA: MOSC domain-containing protein [Methylomirabilota bacterium]|jgi:MOSC domain-containing protein YiiM|nr:MOSC domain-containing protein [Methylomirabilota bacterium]
MGQGSVVSIQIAPEASAPMVPVQQIEAVVGKGLAGDRYFHRAGTYSERPPSAGRQVTLIEAEAIEAIAREAGIEIPAAASRRNITTRGVALNHLVGRRFRVGDVLLEGTRLCEPCTHLESLSKPGVLKALVHRGGLRCDIVAGGTIKIGDVVRAEER